MRAVFIRVLLLGCYGVFATAKAPPRYNCKDDRRYLALDICVVENVDLENGRDLADDQFPNVTHLEFRNGKFGHFEVDYFQLLGDTKRVTFRNGFLKDILFWSHSLEELRVINTELVVFEVISEPNYSLKQLAIRSALFSKWSLQMRLLKALEVIDIGYCNFTHLNLDWFAGYKHLRVLDVSKNRLHVLSSGPFLKLASLEELYLYGNQFEYLWRFPDAFPNVKFLSLSDNKWICNWVTMARDAIFILNIVLMDSDFNCEGGWVNNGGLCCRQNRDMQNVPTIKRANVINDKIDDDRGQLEILLDDRRSGSVEMAIGAEIDGSSVFVDKLLPVILSSP